MMAIIQQAMAMGYAADQILNFIGTKIPKMMGNITQAKSRGYSDDDILKFLSGKIKVNPEKAKAQQSSMERYLSGSGHKTKEERSNDKATFLKGALGVAGTALGGYNLAKQLKGGLSGLSQRGQGGPQIGPQPGTQPVGMPGPATQPISPNQPQNGPVSPQNGPITPPIQANSAKGNGISQPKMPKLSPYQQQQSQMPHDPKQILDDMGMTQSIENLQQAGNDNDTIKKAIEHQVKPFQRDWLRKQTGLDVGAVVDQYLQNPTPNQNVEGQEQADGSAQDQYQNEAQDNLQENGAFTQETPPQQEIAQTQPAKIDKTKLSYEERYPIKKGSTVITPEGDFAKVEDAPGKTAKIDVDGKKRVIEIDEATPVPENEDEILGLYEKLIAKIPETLRSSMLNWVGYDPERNMLQVKFHNGDSYTYENIPPEFSNDLKDVSFLAKTNGGNYYGTWEQGENSRGAGVSQLIRDLQKAYGGKGKEYTGKFKEVYSFLGLPEEKLREKLKREREEKKKRKGTA